MNSPQEKAKELVDKHCANHFEQKRGSIIIDLEKAKKSALISVDEILNNDNNFFNTYSQNDYWLQVKQEINLL